MKLLQSLDSAAKQRTAVEKVYTTANFGKQFALFLEALTHEDLYSSSNKRTHTTSGHMWVDAVNKGGISLTTTKHPMLEGGAAGDVTVRGSKFSVELFESIIKRFAVYEGADTSELAISLEYHDELNPTVWEKLEDGSEQIKPEVHEALLKAGKAFFKFMKVPKVKVVDITITGSSANYNWTESSDIDLHVLVDLEQAEEEYGSIMQEYFDAKKTVWNDIHDISIGGMPVEFYVQNIHEKHYSTGVYSLINEEWVIEPKHDRPNVDDTAIAKKAAHMMQLIDEAIDTNKASKIEEVMEKIRRMRKAGLDEAGEFSTENLAFKVLRNKGYLERLASVRTKTFDRELSVEDEEWSYLKQQMEALPVRQPYIHY